MKSNGGPMTMGSPRRIRVAVLIVIAALAAVWEPHPALAQSDLGSSGNVNQNMAPLILTVSSASSSSCWVCRFIDDLGLAADAYGAQVAGQVASATYNYLWKSVLGLGILWYFFLVLVGGKKIELAELLLKAATALVCTYVLNTAQGGASGWFWTQIYTPLKNVTAGFANQMVTSTASATPGTASAVSIPTQWQNLWTGATQNLTGPYSPLFGSIEHAILTVILNAWAITTMPANTGGGISAIVGGIAAGFCNMLSALLLIAPFAIILIIFGAYIIEAMFMFLAVNCVMPILFICFYFEKARSFFWIGMRIMLGAGLTLVFAGIAMGFTVSATLKYQADLTAAIAAGGALAAFQMPYWIMVFVGFMSIILHLKAKTLATNFSGASDGSGPAAAAATLVGGGAWMLGKRLVGGAAGAGAKAGKQGAGAVGRTASEWLTRFMNRR